MDALDLLEQQHRDVLAILDRLAAEPGVGERAKLVTSLVRMIEAHVEAEGHHLYAACAERAAGGAHEGRFRDACESRALVRFAAENLLAVRVTDVRFEARVEILRRQFESHADEEEGYVFQRAKTELTDEELDVIGEKIARSYELAREAPAPRRTPSRVPRARRGAPRSERTSRARAIASRVVAR
jgi:hypothetical protein